MCKWNKCLMIVWWCVLTQPHTAVLQQITQMIKHGFLILTTDSTEITQESTAARHHFGKSDFLIERSHKLTEKYHKQHKHVSITLNYSSEMRVCVFTSIQESINQTDHLFNYITTNDSLEPDLYCSICQHLWFSSSQHIHHHLHHGLVHPQNPHQVWMLIEDFVIHDVTETDWRSHITLTVQLKHI